jgi:thiol:disulfide interchange protein
MKKLLTLFAAVLLFGSSAFAEVHFKDVSFADALKQAKKEKKIVMVDYYTTWCGWCKRLDRDTYSSDELGKYADENIISLKLDAEKGEGTGLAKKAGVQGYPSIIFYNADGKEIYKVVGYKKAPDFMKDMMAALDKNK